MATASSDPERRRRRQRRRALIGWAGGLLGVAAFVALIVLGGSTHHRRDFRVPYGETMTSGEYAAIQEGEEDAVVLGRLDAGGRPERLTEPYVLELFPPREEGVACTYWEFSDEPQVFARLCFSESSGELVQKLEQSVLPRPGEGEGSMI